MLIHWQSESCESCEMQSMPALVQSPLQVPPAGGQCCCCCCSCYVFIIRLLDIHVPKSQTDCDSMLYSSQ